MRLGMPPLAALQRADALGGQACALRQLFLRESSPFPEPAQTFSKRLGLVQGHASSSCSGVYSCHAARVLHSVAQAIATAIVEVTVELVWVCGSLGLPYTVSIRGSKRDLHNNE